MALTSKHDREFRRLLAGEPAVDLAKLLLEFAADAYPDLQPGRWIAELDELRRRAEAGVEHLGPKAGLANRLAAVSRLLYAEHGFRGNHDDYYDPRNSYLNEVLQRRLGIPISLGIVYMTVAGGAGLEVFGVNAPGHFMLGATEGNQTLYVDPFESGDVLSLEGCRVALERRLGAGAEIGDSQLRPARHLEIAARVLRNLKAAYAMRDQWEQVLPVQSRLSQLLPEMSDEQRDLGLVYLRTGQPSQALAQFDAYLKVCQPDDAQSLTPYVRSARRMLAERN